MSDIEKLMRDMEAEINRLRAKLAKAVGVLMTVSDARIETTDVENIEELCALESDLLHSHRKLAAATLKEIQE